ncbi:flagellar assembly protein FliW [Paenibacillus daejeonensis]|uniref:flagellar assembly protein FliW n=1 Tax=Paenibacillus daejeonensis TaxID=135193 RepID=UPI000377DB63|nr:flagellar assembly protein FliW [Paenibacillus daejeonensis]
MIIATRQLGTVEVQEDSIVVFKHGVPGFETLTRFVLIDLGEELPLRLLQSTERPEVSFFIGNPFQFYPDYEWEMPDELKAELAITASTDVEVWSIVTLASDLSQSTINLLAPIVLNRVQRKGKQYIIHASSFGHAHPIFQR